MVAVAPGAAAPADGPSRDGGLDSLFDEPTAPVRRPRPAGPAGSESLVTTINLSGAVVPAAGPGSRRGAVPLRRIIGARAADGRWPVRLRRAGKVSGWLAGTATVGAGLLALWVLLFATISGGDVWLGRPVDQPVKQEQLVQDSVPGPTPAPAARTAAPTAAKTVPPAKAGPTGAKAAPTADRHGGSSGSAGSSGSGRNGADDPPGDDSGGSRTRTAPTATGGGGDSGGSGSGGSGSSGGSGGSGSGGGSGGGSGRGGHDD